MDKKSIRDAVEIFPLLILIKCTKFLPLRLKVTIGGVFFSVLLQLSRKLRNRVSHNLQLAMPHITSKRKKQFIKEFGNFAGMTFMELIFNEEFQKEVLNFKHSESQLSPIRAAQEQGRPVIIVSAHLGPWEAIRAVLKHYNLTAGAIYKKNKNRFYEPIHLEAIKHGGNPIFPVGAAGTKKMIQYLKKGGIVAVMLDQAAADGEFFSFLGIPAKTSTSIAKLALKLNALVIPAYAIRNIKKQDITVYFEPPIELTTYTEVTSQLTASIEARVSSAPLQWYWLHRRWKY